VRSGSAIVSCPDCGAPHLASAMRRPRGREWQIACRYCGLVPWRAYAPAPAEAAALTRPQLAAYARAVCGRTV